MDSAKYLPTLSRIISQNIESKETHSKKIKTQKFVIMKIFQENNLKKKHNSRQRKCLFTKIPVPYSQFDYILQFQYKFKLHFLCTSSC